MAFILNYFKKEKFNEFDFEELYCPITGSIFLDPVITEDGFTYEKEAIEKWFTTNNRSPTTNLVINKRLFPNRLIKTYIVNLLEKYPSLQKYQYCNNDNISNDDLYPYLKNKECFAFFIMIVGIFVFFHIVRVDKN